jgi:AraC-like DNA-binding protein
VGASPPTPIVLTLSLTAIDWPILSSNASLLPLFEQQAEAVLGNLNGSDRYAQKVTQAIEQQLKGELPGIDTIAAKLAISTRHLQRELQAEGTSFQRLLDETRKTLALRYLANPTPPIHDIAFLLGFSVPSTAPLSAGQAKLHEAIGVKGKQL